MTDFEIITALLDVKRDQPYGDTCSFKLGYLMQVVAEIADKHPAVRLELISRITEIKGN